MRALATSVLAATDPDRITSLQFVGLLIFGLGGGAMGVLHWTGRLKPDARYQTFYGGMAAMVPTGVGLSVVTIGLGLRDALGKPEDWGPWWVISIIGASLVMIGFLYMVVY
ncbi:MAG: hypothetical protein ACRD0U_04535, partial [Acidimicrobiales bacterium]